jgi:hypothetical protein
MFHLKMFVFTPGKMRFRRPKRKPGIEPGVEPAADR